MDHALALRRAQRIAGKSNGELARAIGVSTPYVCHLRSGARGVGGEQVEKLCTALGLPRALFVLLGITGTELAEISERVGAFIALVGALVGARAGASLADLIGEAMRASVAQARGKAYVSARDLTGIVDRPEPRVPAQRPRSATLDQVERMLRRRPRTVAALARALRWPPARVRGAVAAGVRVGRVRRLLDGAFEATS